MPNKKSEEKLEPKPIIVSMASRKIQAIMTDNDLEFDEAFKDWKKHLSDTLSKYDWEGMIDTLKAKCGCDGTTPEKPESKPKGKPKGIPKGKPTTPAPSKPTTPKGTSRKPAMIEPQAGKQIYEMPIGIRAKGEIEVIKTANGTVLRKTDNTKS